MTHLGARYRYFPLFARLEGEALCGALEARAEGLCLQLLDSPTQLAALHAFGWGRLDRWIRAQLVAGMVTAQTTSVNNDHVNDDHVTQRIARELVLALAEDQRILAEGGIVATSRALPPVLEVVVGSLPALEEPTLAPWQIWVITSGEGLGLWGLILRVGQPITALLVHDASAVAATDDAVLMPDATGLHEALVVAPWCPLEFGSEQLEGYVASVVPVDLAEPLPPVSQAQAELRRMFGNFARGRTQRVAPPKGRC
ncbi:MAG: hypothetical protein JRH20_27045 [Deltaproteobacteria bacterium]|nr:hypothetical protein [Deltaproteobacteria bacterium]